MSRGLMQVSLRLFEENQRTNLYVTSEIDEAIFLADRLVVLSNRPAQLRAVIDIDLPRPRHYQVLSSPRPSNTSVSAGNPAPGGDAQLQGFHNRPSAGPSVIPWRPAHSPAWSF